MSQQFVTSTGTATAPRLREFTDVVAPSEPGFIYARRISWASIFAGTAVAATTQMVLTLLGAGIGLLALGHYADRGASDTALGIWAGLYLLLTGLLSLFVGGAIASRGARVTPCL